MMNAEEEDLDLDLNVGEDCTNQTTDDGACIIPPQQPLPEESPVSSPVAPIHYQNLINDEGGRNTDDDMKKFDSLSSGKENNKIFALAYPYEMLVPVFA